jgi:hypothetical protein
VPATQAEEDAAPVDKLKPYVVPLVALALMLAWYFVIRPMLAQSDADSGSDEVEAPTR